MVCKLVEDYAKEYVEEQKRKRVIEITLNLIADGTLNDEQIAKASGLSVNEVEELRANKDERQKG